jgi:cytoskeletal protein RodZ
VRKNEGGKLKRVMILAALLAIVVVLAIPAIAAANGNNGNNNNDNNKNDNNKHHHDNNRHHDNNDNGTELSQDNAQDTQSGASSQGIIIEGPGDNANQCIGLQPISNTGNAADNTDALQYASGGDVGVDNAGNLSMKPSQTTTCDQKVDQAASANGQ